MAARTQSSALAPLASKAFRVLWIADVAGTVGTWMNDTATSLTMTQLTASPLTIALVGAAGSLPILLLSLPAGALADVLDKRRILLTANVTLTALALAYAAAAYFGLLSPLILLAATFGFGIGAAIVGPAFDSAVPTMVEKPHLAGALTLQSIGINVGRAVGPALGGLLFAFVGAWLVFLLDAVTFLGFFFAVLAWHPGRRPSSAPAERFIAAQRGGIRYIRYSPGFRAVLTRTGAFILCASALWALLPTRLRLGLHVDALRYGLIIGAFGAGAIVTALLLPRIKARLTPDQVAAASIVILAGLLVALGLLANIPLIAICMFIGGGAWIGQMSSLNVAANFASAEWVRGRALSVYVTVFQGGMFVGTLAWGFMATRFDPSIALLSAAGLLVLSLLLGFRYRLSAAHGMNLEPSLHWPEPTMSPEGSGVRRAALVMVEYRIAAADHHAFLEAMKPIRRQRLRDGAYAWGIYEDPDIAGVLIESFQLESWAEHLRQHARVTKHDAEAQAVAQAFHRGQDPPRVRHLVSPAPE
jgi:MFS family permease